MNRYKLSFSLAIFWISLFTNCSGQNQLKTISAFNSIDTTPMSINFSNDLEINNNGGHIQGIQKYENESGKFLFMSGSSDSYSYCVVVKLGDENKVVSVNKLMDKPLKHAGGFQVFQNYLAVGIEDNSIKDKAKVCIYDISEPENPFAEPIVVIERKGEPLRSTAGCVGMTKYKNKVLVAVGDWDTKHIDFYSADFDKLTGKGFTKIGTVDTENISRTGWINNEWYSYQNINLLNIDSRLFLIGLGHNQKAENIGDLYEVSEDSAGIFVLKKVATKTFNCTNECNFKAAAGVKYDKGEFTILASSYNINSISYLNVFSSK